jgi:predicted N-acetyltransferase YhbS
MKITLRPAKPEDTQACASICFEAFKSISQAHNFPLDIPAPEVASQIISWMFSHPGFYTVVAEADGRIVGSNALDKRNAILGIGPITVDPGVQNKAVGRALMADVMARGTKAPGIRLVQAAFHNRSLSLYTKLGFEVREPLACINGPRIQRKLAGYEIRPALPADLEPCAAVCRKVHGHDRSGELLDAIKQGSATVVEHHSRITGYATIIGFFGHAVGETNNDLKALIGATPAIAGSGFLLPTRNAELFRWCLAQGLRVTQPLTLMSVGLYNEPAGAFLPSITY